MSPRSENDFDSSDEKILIRQGWDLPLIVAAQEARGRPLNYFGLPGPNIQDILDWRDYLDAIAGVERLRSGKDRDSDLERHRRLLRNVMQNEIQGFQLLRGDIDDVILNGLDLDEEAPRLHRGGSQADMRFFYDLVNLDYVGGVGYPSRRGRATGESKRVRAIKKLFDRQQGTAFLLFLTINVRDTIDAELRSFLTNTGGRVDEELREVLQWYVERGPAEKKYVLKAVIPLFIQRIAEDFMFASHCYPPVAYTGSGNAVLVHFAFDLLPKEGSFQAFSKQTTADLLRLPLVTTAGCEIRIDRDQHPNFDFPACTAAFGFLPEELQRDICAAAAEVAAPS